MNTHETNSLKKTKVLVGMAIFTALVVVLQQMAGIIKIGPFTPSLVLIPIVIGAAVYGAKAGAWLGLVFSICVLVAVVTGQDTGGYLMWGTNPAMTAAIVLAKGIAAGFLAGLVFRMLQKKNQMLATVAAAIVCPVVNTGLFLIGTLAVFEPLLTQWAQGWMEATGRTDASLGTYLIVGMVGLNFLIELGINMILSPVVVRILKIRKVA